MGQERGQNERRPEDADEERVVEGKSFGLEGK